MTKYRTYHQSVKFNTAPFVPKINISKHVHYKKLGLSFCIKNNRINATEQKTVNQKYNYSSSF